MRPAILCKLKKGVLIDANPGFVDTFNWMVDFINNICGDGDLDKGKPITVDKTIDDHPVIRGTFAGGGASGCNFSYNPTDHSIADGYVIIARTPTSVNGTTVTGAGLVYLEVIASSSSYTATITTGAGSLPAPTDTKTYIPLYQIDSNFAVTADYRGAPQIQLYE